jgi:PIN domain nuclease of toxin-antitoxin system
MEIEAGASAQLCSQAGAWEQEGRRKLELGNKKEIEAGASAQLWSQAGAWEQEGRLKLVLGNKVDGGAWEQDGSGRTP